MRMPILNAVVLVAAMAESMACAARLADQAASPGGSCPPGRVANYMAAGAQQCWYSTPQGQWRIVNHEFHYDVLVVQTEASTLEMTGEIVSRLADVHGERFVEILIYVRAGAGRPAATIRRARWTDGGRVEHFDFPAT